VANVRSVADGGRITNHCDFDVKRSARVACKLVSLGLLGRRANLQHDRVEGLCAAETGGMAPVPRVRGAFVEAAKFDARTHQGNRTGCSVQLEPFEYA
jgi:hypothetical protein